MELHLIETGATIQRLLVPDAKGNIGDIAAGFDNPEDYTNETYAETPDGLTPGAP